MAWGKWQVQEKQEEGTGGEDLYGIPTEELAADEEVPPSPGGQERATPQLPPVKLPVRRKRATKEEVRLLGKALDPSLLGVLPPHITDQLTPRQELWLVARSITYSNVQACRHAGTSQVTLARWMQGDAFQEAYKVVVLDPLNFSLGLHRLMQAKAAVQKLQLMQHPNLTVRLRVIEMVDRQAATLAAAESKTNIRQQNILAIPSGEYLRELLAKGWVIPPDDEPPAQLDAGAGIIGLLEGEFRPLEVGPVHEDQGRERQPDPPLRAVGLADPAAAGAAAAEVQHHPQGPAARGELVDGTVGLVDGELPPQ
jgi:hypothetical protein